MRNKMHITLSKLLENTARSQLQAESMVEFKKAYWNKALQKKALKQRITALRKMMDDVPEFKQRVLDQCKYGRERAMRLSILRRKFDGIC